MKKFLNFAVLIVACFSLHACFLFYGAVVNPLYLNKLVNQAKEGDVETQVRVGKIYYGGHYDKYYNSWTDYQAAYFWFNRAASSGNAEAEYYLGLLSYYGKGVPQDYDTASRFFQSAVKKGGNAPFVEDANNKLKELYSKGYDGFTQTNQKKEAAAKGDANAQYELGQMYAIGKGVEHNDEEAAKWMMKAALKGNAAAQNNLGYFYENGIGVKRDYYEAVKWYKKGALGGDVSAQHNLAKMYFLGKGTDQNYEQTYYWYKKASDQNHGPSQNSLGVMYETGTGIAQNKYAALDYYERACENKSKEGCSNYYRLKYTGSVKNAESIHY